jgi:hypothetical protein
MAGTTWAEGVHTAAGVSAGHRIRKEAREGDKVLEGSLKGRVETDVAPKSRTMSTVAVVRHEPDQLDVLEHAGRSNWK